MGLSSWRDLSPVVLLVDHGSVDPEPTRLLRTISRAVEARCGLRVFPASLKHSDRVKADSLDGRGAKLLAETLRGLACAGEKRFILVPLFFAPGYAVANEIPRIVRDATDESEGFEGYTLAPLVNLSDRFDTGVAEIIASGVRDSVEKGALRRPPAVAVVDHGTPEPAVNTVRGHLARQIEELMGKTVSDVAAASMERRAGTEYDFNDPLLENLLNSPGFTRDVVVAPVFLAPGRHAGPGGDIDRICAKAQIENPELNVIRSPLVGQHPEFPALIADRVLGALGR